MRIARALPFIVFALLSFYIAARAPRGRHAPRVDFSLASADITRSLTKAPHLGGAAIFFFLAVLAFGIDRLGRAFAATMLVGIGWEIGEMTVVGHYARLADLVPNIVSALICLAIVAGIRAIARRRA